LDLPEELHEFGRICHDDVCEMCGVRVREGYHPATIGVDTGSSQVLGFEFSLFAWGLYHISRRVGTEGGCGESWGMLMTATAPSNGVTAARMAYTGNCIKELCRSPLYLLSSCIFYSRTDAPPPILYP
jgi:hypothetical protein